MCLAAHSDRCFRARMFSGSACSTPGCRALSSAGRWQPWPRSASRRSGRFLHQLGTMTGADTTLNAAWVIVPLILIAECFSWHAVLTTNYLGNAIENSIWAVAFFVVGIGLCRLLPEFDGEVRVVLAITIIGIAGYLAFLMAIDVPMYLSRWRALVADGGKLLRPLEGLRDVSTRWIVTHDLAEWKDEITWMSLYFSAAVWASLALCVCYSLEDHLPRYRTEATVASGSSDALVVISKQPPVMAR